MDIEKMKVQNHPTANDKDETPETPETKSFLFRQVPGVMHRAWKIAAALRGIGMEDFGLRAIRDAIGNTIGGNKDEKKS